MLYYQGLDRLYRKDKNGQKEQNQGQKKKNYFKKNNGSEKKMENNWPWVLKYKEQIIRVKIEKNREKWSKR